MAKRIAVDIDNTLWDFAPILYQRLRRVNPFVPEVREWTVWDFWKPYVSPRILYEIIKNIHMEQEGFLPYQAARAFLARLKESEFHIIVASHREKGTLDSTVRWLDKHGLFFDEVHLSYDKSVLFDHCWAVVDDSPVTLEKAAKAGIVRAGIRNPWNEQSGHPVFENLMGVLGYLESQCIRNAG